MIDRKLLKTNRWEDEEYLQARMTNACFNGGGGGDGGAGDDFFGDDDDVSGGYEFGDEERSGMAAEIEAQMAAQEAARQQEAAAQVARQQAANQQEQEMARQAQAQAQAQAAAAQADRERQMAAIDRQMEMAAIDRQMADQAASRAAEQAAHVARQQGANQQEQEMAAQAAASTVTRTAPHVTEGTIGQIPEQSFTWFREPETYTDAYRAGTPEGGFLDTTRSPVGTGVEGFGTHAQQTGGGGWTVQGTLDQQRRANEAAAAGLDPVNQEGFFDKFGNWVDKVFGMPTDVRTQIDTFTEIDPTTGNVHHSDGRITDGTTGQTIQEPTKDWNAPWYIDRPNWDRSRPEGGGGDERGVDPADGRVKPITDFIVRPPVGPPVGPPGGPPGGPGFPPGGGGGYPPGGGGGGWPPGGGGGGYPPTWGAGGRTGGGMPGYMANYPIHSQNLFNFTPARAMPGIDPSYQPWMQPAQGMDQNLWNYQAPNLLPWDMTNRVPWNFATTPTGQYGPMVATVGGQPADGGDRGNA